MSKPMYPPYDKCYVKIEYDLTPIAFVKHKKNAQNTSFKNHKKNFIINSKLMCPLYDRCHIKKEYDMTPFSFVITVK